MKKLFGVVLALLVLGIGCTQPAPAEDLRYSYLPDGRMVLLQTSGEDKPVEFPDSNLELVIRDKLESMGTLAVGESIYTKDLEEIVYLDAAERGIINIDGLEYLINLCYVNLRDNQILDPSPLGKLPGGQIVVTGGEPSLFTALTIALDHNRLSNITGLSGLRGVDEVMLFLGYNTICDLSPLAEVGGLMYLNIPMNNITDLSPLAGLLGLTVLHLYGNQIEDVGPLRDLSVLMSLVLSHNYIRDISALSGLTAMRHFSITNNFLEDFPCLDTWTDLQTIDLSWNQITDASPVECLPKSCWVNLEGNPLK